MDNKRYWKKPLTLNELLDEAERIDNDDIATENIYILPPDNANADITDEDSGDEENVDINNLPGSQLITEAEIHITAESEVEEDWESEDDLPLSTFIPKKRRKTTLQYSEWVKEDLVPNLPDWTSVSGPVNQMTPVQTFFLFFDDDVITMLVEYTNTYARTHNKEGDVTEDEMRCFIGILLLSGYVCLPRRHMYWENSTDCKNSLVSDAMSRNRFRYIMQNFHCNDNAKLLQNDRFSKMRPLFDMLNKRFITFAPVEEQHSIDESMIPYYGRHGAKQFIRGKPIRWGYKMWCATTRWGYIEWFDPYQGSSSTLPEKYAHLGLGPSVVLQFVNVLEEVFPNMPHDLYFDNYFTTLPLLKTLEQRGIKGTGTIRENRLGKDCPLQPSRQIKSIERGSFEYACCDKKIAVCKWHDNSVVCVASNHNQVFPTQAVKRFSQKEKKSIQVSQPFIIKRYNEHMGGVDRADQNMSLYRVSIRGKKWYFPLISHCVDMAEQNAWLIHRHQGGKLDHLAFRRSLAQGILETFRKTTKSGTRTSSNLHLHSRYDGKDHLIIYQEKQTRCGMCHKKCNFLCQKCRVTLHPKDCFLAYHTL